MAAGRDITIYQGGARPEPAVDAEAAVEAYLARVREVYRRLNLDVLGPSGLAGEQPVIELRQVYIPQDYDAYETRFAVDRALRLHPMSAHGEDPPPILQLIGGSRELRLVVIGDPGGGKSTLTKFLALALAGALETLPAELTPLVGLVPVVVELRQYARQPERTIEEFLEFIHAQERMGLPRSVLTQLFADGDALVAFDGLDEIFDPELRSTVARRIAGFASAYPRVRTIVTTREHGYRPSDFSSADFRHVKLRNLDTGQVEDFTHRWYTAAHPAEPARAEQLAGRLLHAVHNIRAVRDLAENPMLLTVLAAIGLGHTIPRERRRVYAHAIEVLVERLDRDAKFLTPTSPKNAEAAQALEWLNAGRTLKLLERVARQMQSDARQPAGTFIQHDELTGIIGEFLVEHNIGRPAAEIAADFLVERLRTRNFLLAHYGGGNYGFVHRTFLEYLASSDLVRRREEEEWTREEFVDLLDERAKDPAWHEVVLLTAGRLKQRDVAALLARLLERHRRREVEPGLSSLSFAIRVLAEVEEVGSQAGQLSVAEQSDAVVDALTIAFRREAMIATQEALPALRTFDRFWSGRPRYLRWYHATLCAAGIPGLTMAWRVASALSHDDELRTAEAFTVWGYLQDHIFPSADRKGRSAANPRITELQGLAKRSSTDHSALISLHAAVTDDPEPESRLIALDLLLEHRGRDARTFPVLEAATRDAAPEVRIRALQQLTGYWPVPEPSANYSGPRHRLIVDIIAGDDDPDVRIFAMHVLRTIWKLDPGTWDTFRSVATDDRDPAVRISALRHIATSPYHRRSGDPAVLHTALGDRDGAVRISALHHLTRRWYEHPDTWPALRTATRDDEPWVRAEALRLLADDWTAHPDAHLAIREATDDEAPAVRTEALHLLSEYWFEHSDTHPTASKALADPAPGVRIAALQVLAARYTETALRPALDLARKDPSDQVRAAAVKFLALAWPDEPESVETINRLSTDPSEEVRTVVAEALSLLRPENPLA